MTGVFFVAAKAIIKNEEGKYLIVYRSQSDTHAAGKADLPGGKIDPDETIEQGLHREVKEEADLEIEIIRPLRTWGFKNDNHETVGITFLTKHKGGKVSLSWEHESFEWLSREELLNRDVPKWLRSDFEKIHDHE